MLALRNEERSLRQALFFSELEDRDALVVAFERPPVVVRHQPPQSSLLPAEYVELCNELARHVGGQRAAAADEEIEGVNEEVSRLPTASYPGHPSQAGLTLPTITSHDTTGLRIQREKQIDSSPDPRSGLDERIAFLCDQKYGAFKADRGDAQSVAKTVLLRDNIVW